MSYINDDTVIAPALLGQATPSEIEASIERLIELIEINNAALIDVFCDGAELDRERSAYESAELAHHFELLQIDERELAHEGASLAYLLARTLKHQRSLR